MGIEELPKHLKDELEKQANKEEAERKQREIDRNTCKVGTSCYWGKGKVDIICC